MEVLKYIVEDKTIAELLGKQNFINDESAVLELVKNSYDARASFFELVFSNDSITVIDDGNGMNSEDIKKYWMHIGKSKKEYEVVDKNNNKRVLAGSKGIGRFALARLGEKISLYSKKANFQSVLWKTDWETSEIVNDSSWDSYGTKIVITELREKWTIKKVKNLMDFLGKTYNDNSMSISIAHPNISSDIYPAYSEPKLGRNCLSAITLRYDANTKDLFTEIESDEFLDVAQNYCQNINLKKHSTKTNMLDELQNINEYDLDAYNIEKLLTNLGDFNAQFLFAIKPTTIDKEKFLYKHSDLPEKFSKGIVLFRNAFSISSYEGNRDWLGLGKRSRKSPAAATHPTGTWRVRENQITGKVVIDKKHNAVLQDLSNRQGLNEDIYYALFIEIVLSGISEFEQYRQEIIRCINVKNNENIERQSPVSDKIISNPNSISKLTTEEAKQLSLELKTYKKDSKTAKKEKADVENRYKYDIRILNVLSTIGLKASSIAHEMRNDKNTVLENVDNIIEALKEYGMWEELNSAYNTKYAYRNVPELLNSSAKVNEKIVTFMNVMLSETEKRKFKKAWQSISDIVNQIIINWESDYGRIKILLDMDEDICFNISEDIIQVILDNLILNSYQQNESLHTKINIRIRIKEFDEYLYFEYLDNGKGLHPKYLNNPRKILEVHETTRKNGHGLGMWIVNNTITMTGGEIKSISGENGFKIEFLVGGEYSG